MKDETVDPLKLDIKNDFDKNDLIDKVIDECTDVILDFDNGYRICVELNKKRKEIKEKLK